MVIAKSCKYLNGESLGAYVQPLPKYSISEINVFEISIIGYTWCFMCSSSAIQSTAERLEVTYINICAYPEIVTGRVGYVIPTAYSVSPE